MSGLGRLACASLVWTAEGGRPYVGGGGSRLLRRGQAMTLPRGGLQSISPI